MAARNHTGRPCYLRAPNINLILTHSTFEGLLSFVSNTVQSFGFFALQGFIFSLICGPGQWFLYCLLAETVTQKQRTGVFERGLQIAGVTARGCPYP